MDFGAEDVVGFEEPGCEEEGGHDAGCPIEDEEREGGGQAWRGGWFCFAEDDAAQKRDAGGECEEEERIEDAVVEGLVGKKDEMWIFDGEEESVKDGVEGEQAEEKGDGFGEFEQHAPRTSGMWGSLPRLGIADPHAVHHESNKKLLRSRSRIVLDGKPPRPG